MTSPGDLQAQADALHWYHTIDLGNGGMPIVVNRYVVQHGNDKSLALYWYQSRDRVVASDHPTSAASRPGRAVMMPARR